MTSCRAVVIKEPSRGGRKKPGVRKEDEGEEKEQRGLQPPHREASIIHPSMAAELSSPPKAPTTLVLRHLVRGFLFPGNIAAVQTRCDESYNLLAISYVSPELQTTYPTGAICLPSLISSPLTRDICCPLGSASNTEIRSRQSHPDGSPGPDEILVPCLSFRLIHAFSCPSPAPGCWARPGLVRQSSDTLELSTHLLFTQSFPLPAPLLILDLIASSEKHKKVHGPRPPEQKLTGKCPRRGVILSET